MPEKPPSADDYSRVETELVEQACLYVATKLGDLMDEIVVVGGLVPSLLVDPVREEGIEPHVGTRDLDLGFTLAILDQQRYKKISKRLRQAGFEPAQTKEGNTRRQKWHYTDADVGVELDFLIPPADESRTGGEQQNLEEDFAAIVTPGLELAFQNPIDHRLSGKTIAGEKAERTVQVCNPGVFVVLKAFAFDSRGENKDAYDLFYMVQNWGDNVGDVVQYLPELEDSQHLETALDIIERDFTGDIENVGPLRVAEFLHGGPDDITQANVTAGFEELCRRYETVMEG